MFVHCFIIPLFCKIQRLGVILTPPKTLSGFANEENEHR